MHIENLTWNKDENKISWNYDGCTIVADECQDFSTVRIDMQRELVSGLLRDKENISLWAYYSFEGKKVFEVNFPDNKIMWLNNGQWVIKCFDHMKIADYYPQNNLILIGTGEKTYPEKVVGLSMEGEILFEMLPPEKATFWYFGIFNGLPNVACLGGEPPQGTSGRSGYWFEINPLTGELRKRDFAY